MTKEATSSSRNEFRQGGLVISPLLRSDVEKMSDEFCQDPDMNDFFKNDALTYEDGLWIKNYKVYFESEPDYVIGLVGVLNDGLRFNSKSQHKKETPQLKRYLKTHPAMKIGRLAVNKDLKGQGVGSLLLQLVKAFFLFENRTGCRVITVDAYNHPKVIGFYQDNGFIQINEPENSKESKDTVSMFFKLVGGSGR